MLLSVLSEIFFTSVYNNKHNDMRSRLLQQQSFCLRARKLKSFLFLILVVFSSALFAQNNQVITIVGRVAAGDTALMGVTVNVKGTSTTTQTDANGRFTIQAPANGVLVFSSVGYGVQEVRINNRASLNINLQSSNRRMDEVIVVGYATQRRATVTGAVSSVNSADLTVTPSNTTSGALVGKVQGITTRAQAEV
jgi:hypothetical protein